ncbi:MAG: exonuclease [Magnetococcus sp. WYHC-3]
MLSLASAAFLEDKTITSTFSANLETLPDAMPHPETVAWWKTNPEAWAVCRRDCLPPEAAMKKYLLWLKALPGKPIFVGYPAAFDFLFVYWYLISFTGESPFGHNAVDIRSYAMGMLKTDYGASGKRHLPARWFDNLPHTHVALDDAIEQGALFCNMLRENRQP